MILPAAAVPEHRPRLLSLEDWAEHTASLLARVQRSGVRLRHGQGPLRVGRGHRGWLAEGTPSGPRRRVLAGTRGPRQSEGNHHRLRPGYRGTKCCPDSPQTRRTQGWSCPRSHLKSGVKLLYFHTRHNNRLRLNYKGNTKEKLCPLGGGVARRPPTDAGTTLPKEYRFPVWKSQTPGIPVLPTLESIKQPA